MLPSVFAAIGRISRHGPFLPKNQKGDVGDRKNKRAVVVWGR